MVAAWQAAGTMRRPRCGLALASDARRDALFLVGGYSGGLEYQDTVETFDPESGRGALLGPQPSSRLTPEPTLALVPIPTLHPDPSDPNPEPSPSLTPAPTYPHLAPTLTMASTRARRAATSDGCGALRRRRELRP